MRAILINPTNQAIEELHLASTPAALNKYITSVLGCKEYATVSSYDEEVELLVNPNALFDCETTGFLNPYFPIIVYGTALIVGNDPITKSTTSLKDAFNYSDVKKVVMFLDKQESDVVRPIVLALAASSKQ